MFASNHGGIWTIKFLFLCSLRCWSLHRTTVEFEPYCSIARCGDNPRFASNHGGIWTYMGTFTPKVRDGLHRTTVEFEPADCKGNKGNSYGLHRTTVEFELFPSPLILCPLGRFASNHGGIWTPGTAGCLLLYRTGLHRTTVEFELIYISKIHLVNFCLHRTTVEFELGGKKKKLKGLASLHRTTVEFERNAYTALYSRGN